MGNNDLGSATTPRPTVQRRTLVKGAAWAVPAVAVAAATPAYAASPIPPNGLNGWVTLTRGCLRASEFQIDGSGNFTGGGPNDRGIWTFVADPAAVINNAQIIFYLNRSDAVFTNSSGDGWSNLARSVADDSTSPATGYYAYVTTYTGLWTYFPAYGAWVANNDPYWLWDMSTCNTVSAYARRTITVNATTVTFLRGPVSV